MPRQSSRLFTALRVLIGGGACVAGVLVACSSGDTSSSPATPTGPVLSGSADAGAFEFLDDAGDDAGPLLAPCTPSNPSSCPTGYVCFSQHTLTSWWVDLYGTCTFDCTSETEPLCSSLDGVCGCPVFLGQVAGNCSDDGGASMVCVPALRPGAAPGANDGDGGCGTPGCSGGPPVEAGPLPGDSGTTD